MVDAVAKAAGCRSQTYGGPSCSPAISRLWPRSRSATGEKGSPASASSCFSRSARCSPRPRATSRPGSSASTTPYVEWKLDGARVQAAPVGDEVAVFTRNLADMTARVPEIVEAVRACDADVARARRRGDRIAPRRPPRAVPGDDEPLRDEGRSRAATRAAALVVLLRLPARRRRGPDRPAGARAAAPRSSAGFRTSTRAALVTADPEAAERVPRRRPRARPRGRRWSSRSTRPTRRGGAARAWLKVKPAHTLDLVVLAAEWGHGRRHGQALEPPPRRARPASGGLRHARQDLQGHDRRDARVADGAAARRSRPVATGTSSTCGPSSSSRSPSTACRRARTIRAAMALRFARVKGYRPDKRADEADTIETVRAIHAPAE